MSITLTNTINYSGMLNSKTDESTRLLNAIYSRGSNGGRVPTRSTQFVLTSGYDLGDPSQPNISETASLIAPEPETTERIQDTNVVQIYQRTVAVSYMKQTNIDAMGGANIAGQANNVVNELDWQVGIRVKEMLKDLNYTCINGIYQYTAGSAVIAPRSRGLKNAITTNKFDIANVKLTKKMINDAVKEAIANGADPSTFVIWVNPDMLDIITEIYSLTPGFNQPNSNTEGGIAITRILTPYGILTVEWEPQVPTGTLMFLNMGELAIAEKIFSGSQGEMIGSLFYEPLAKTGASERGQLYSELGLHYGAEWLHAMITNISMV